MAVPVAVQLAAQEEIPVQLEEGEVPPLLQAERLEQEALAVTMAQRVLP
jgi:hypothetical protein